MGKRKTRQPCDLLADLDKLDHISRQSLRQGLIEGLTEYALDWAKTNARKDPFSDILTVDSSDPGVTGSFGSGEVFWLNGGPSGPILVVVPQYSYPGGQVCGVYYGYFALDHISNNQCSVSSMLDHWAFGEIKFSSQLGNTKLTRLFGEVLQILKLQYC